MRCVRMTALAFIQDQACAISGMHSLPSCQDTQATPTLENGPCKGLDLAMSSFAPRSDSSTLSSHVLLCCTRTLHRRRSQQSPHRVLKRYVRNPLGARWGPTLREPVRDERSNKWARKHGPEVQRGVAGHPTGFDPVKLGLAPPKGRLRRHIHKCRWREVSCKSEGRKLTPGIFSCNSLSLNSGPVFATPTSTLSEEISRNWPPRNQ